MRKLVVLVLFVFSVSVSNAGDGDYAVSKIPAALLKNANAVKRIDVTEYEVFSLGKARLRQRYAITILNENGDKFAGFYTFYDKWRSIRSVEGSLYDAGGNEIKSLKDKDVKDYSAVSSISLMEDSRVKTHEFNCRQYPYTVEYEVVTDFNNTFFTPDWYPQYGENISLEKATMLIKTPLAISFNYKILNCSKSTPEVEEGKDSRTFTWSIEQVPAMQKEYASPNWRYLAPCGFFTFNQFEVGSYSGSYATWKDMGLFQLALNKDRDKLPDNIKAQVHSIADNVADQKEKVRLLYEYMQKNTRYISIQLGIGGWQPFEAAYVAKNAYGDCKALSNYMYSLLKEAGIRSHYTLIKSGTGERFFTPEFPQDLFNHIILCVPMAKDTMWLECTSQTLSAGYLSDFTCDRYALLVTEEGGKLVRTPKYGINENQEIRRVKAALDEEGTLNINARTEYTGLQQDDYHSLITQLSKDKVKEVLHERLDFGTYDISSFDYKETKSSLPMIEEKLDIVVSNYATITGRRLFIVPNVMTRTNRKLSTDEDRKYDLDLSFEYRDIDTVEIAVPTGYSPEAMPKDVMLNSKFGHYESVVKLNGDKLFYYRKMEHYSGRFPAADYAELVKFYETIYKADRNKVVLVKKE